MIEPASNTWVALKAHIEARLKEIEPELASEETVDRRTQSLRGRIGELKAILNLVEPQPEIPAGSGRY